MRGDADDAELYDIAQNPQRVLGSGDEAVFAVVIQKYLEVVADAGAFGYESFREEDTFLAIVKDETEVQVFFYL